MVKKQHKTGPKNTADDKNAKEVVMGPNPIIVFLVVVSCIVLMSIVFAAIKLFLVGDALLGRENIIAEEGSVQVLFCQQEPCETKLISELNGTNDIKCAFYDLDLNDTIITLKDKNASLLVYDDKAYEDLAKFDLTAPQAKRAISEGLMHNKFCILDKDTANARVITGSMNPTRNDAEKNDNNLLIIRSKTLAKRYDKEYAEISSRIAKSYKKNPSEPTHVNISGIYIEQRFCPQENCEEAVIEELGKANKSILFMTFSFTSDPIGQELIAASNRNVSIKGIFERRQVDKWTELEKLKAFGMEVTTDANPNTMHHKVFIIDGNTVITGSYNPTANGNTRNDENLLIIHDNTIASLYEKEFDRVYGTATGK